MTELDGRLFGPDQPCFGCGPIHPSGFRLRFTEEGEDLVTRFVPGDGHQGPPGIMHGGLVATLADELGAWVLVAKLGKFGFTAAMNLRLERAVRTGVEVVGRARVEKNLRRIVDVRIELEQGGATAVTGDLRFVLLDKGGAERLLGRSLPPAWERFSR
jgi:acyl-coenzyme A thioesterase PaaI-like protein